MHQLSLHDLANGLRQKQFSSVELTQYYLERAKKINPVINAATELHEEHALKQAKIADQRLSTNDRLTPLTGIPIFHKDLFCTTQGYTTCSSAMLKGFKAPYNATVVQRMDYDAGMVCLGKASMDEFAMGSSNEKSHNGPCLNPWDLERVPGGSSGGSAAIVAARMAPAATGTDTGGSIRQPAAFCGITGLKPTYGRVSRFGMIAYASSLDQAGPMAKSAYDCGLLLQAMAGFDGQNDSTSHNIPVPDYTSHIDMPLSGLTIGLPKEFFNDDLDPKMAARLQEVIELLKKEGVNFKSITLPNQHLSIPAYYVLAPAECSSNLARFDGVRFGHRCDNPENLSDLYGRSRYEGFGEEVKRRIFVGTYVLSSGSYECFYQKAQKIRVLIQQDYLQAFSDVDLILSPVTPSPAFKLGEKSKDPVQMYYSDIYTIATNLAGLPGLSAPAGFIDGLPVGYQLTANAFSESVCLRVAHRLQQITDWHKQMPTDAIFEG